MSAARRRWIDEGVRVLAENGSAALRIDPIAARLGLSKGSFHHHFAGADDFKRAILGEYRRLSVGALEQAIEGSGGAPGRDVIVHLAALIAPASVLYRPEPEVAVRAWAVSDADARCTLGEVVAARVQALQRVWRTLTPNEDDARRRALLPYLVAVGASVVEPPIGADELREVIGLLMPLVPVAPDGAEHDPAA